MSSKIKVAIADPYIVLRQGLACLINSLPDFSVVADVCTVRQLLFYISKTEEKPDVFIIEATPSSADYEAVVILEGMYPDIPIIVLSAYDFEFIVLKMIQAGVNAYLSKRCSPTDLTNTMLFLQQNRYCYTDTAPKILFTKSKCVFLPELTEREFECLVAIHSHLRIEDAIFTTEASVKEFMIQYDNICKKFRNIIRIPQLHLTTQSLIPRADTYICC